MWVLGRAVELSCGLLLRHAVQSAQAPNEVYTVDTGDFPAREALSQDIQCEPVIRIVEGRDEDDSIGDIEVRIAGRKPYAVEVKRSRHR